MATSSRPGTLVVLIISRQPGAAIQYKQIEPDCVLDLCPHQVLTCEHAFGRLRIKFIPAIHVEQPFRCTSRQPGTGASRLL